MAKKANRKQVGCTVDTDLWKRFRTQAVQEERSTGQLLEEAIRLYLKTVNAEDSQPEKN